MGVFAQAIGILGMIANIVSYQCKEKHKLLLLQLVGGGLFAVNMFLLDAVNDQLQIGTATVRVLPCEETWFGVTYREDLESVKDAICEMKRRGIYDKNLWN